MDLIGLPPTRDEIAEFQTDNISRCLEPGRGFPLKKSTLRRALGPALDGCLALQRLGRL